MFVVIFFFFLNKSFLYLQLYDYILYIFNCIKLNEIIKVNKKIFFVKFLILNMYKILIELLCTQLYSPDNNKLMLNSKTIYIIFKNGR